LRKLDFGGGVPSSGRRAKLYKRTSVRRGAKIEGNVWSLKVGKIKMCPKVRMALYQGGLVLGDSLGEGNPPSVEATAKGDLGHLFLRYGFQVAEEAQSINWGKRIPYSGGRGEEYGSWKKKHCLLSLGMRKGLRRRIFRRRDPGGGRH